MAEMVYRRRRRRVRMMDERRFIGMPGRAQCMALLQASLRALPAFLLTLTPLLDMPSGLYAALIASLAALGKPIRWAVVGAAAAVAIQALCGQGLRWDALLTLLFLTGTPWLLQGRGNIALTVVTGVTLLPMLASGWMAPTVRPGLLAAGGLLVAALSAPLICRGVKVLDQLQKGDARATANIEDRLGLAFLLLMMVCGGGHLYLAWVHAGILMASVCTMVLALHMGAAAGCAAGIVSGVGLALTGMPMLQAVALATGGFLAGVMKLTERRRLSCASFGMTALAVMLLSGTAGRGCGLAVVAASGGMMALPAAWMDALRRLLRRLTTEAPSSGDAYAACMLAEWERTVDAMARSVPMPSAEEGQRDGTWWTERLCEGCNALSGCGGVRSATAVAGVEAVWSYRSADDERWQGALEGLRGLGCQRLYYLRQGMDALRDETAVQAQHVRHAMSQRGMLVTHLNAMAGAARRFAHLSLGESWWDALQARRIRMALTEAAAPMQLLWLRRVEGHIQAAFGLEDLTAARYQARELCALVAEATGVPMMTVSIDGGRVRLAQRPPMEVRCGVAIRNAEGQRVSGDTAWHGLLQDGRFMATLGDGMGHGEKAALSSRQTAELLRLCLDAGYPLQQTLTAVNGMMLLGESGERFITVDLLTIDLWSGQAVLEKLGSAGSYLMHEGRLLSITAEALPMGILDNVDAAERVLRLVPGDALILMTDGVEEAFADREAMEASVQLSLAEEDAREAAAILLRAAEEAGKHAHRDDMTVMVLRLEAVQDAADDV